MHKFNIEKKEEVAVRTETDWTLSTYLHSTVYYKRYRPAG